MAFTPVRYALGPGAGEVVTGRNGWLYWALPDRGLEAFIHLVLQADGYAFDIVAIRATQPDIGVTGPSLRDIPLGRLHAALRNPDLADRVRRAWISRSAPVFDPAKARWEDASATLAVLPQHQVETPEYVFDVPEGRRKGREFYLLVFSLYQAAAQHSSRPAMVLAEANNIEPAKIRQWVRQGRDLAHKEYEELLRRSARRAWRQERERRPKSKSAPDVDADERKFIEEWVSDHWGRFD